MPQSRMSQFMQQFGKPQSGNPWGQRPPQRPGPFPGYGNPAPQPPMKPGPQPVMPPPAGPPVMGHMGPGSMPMPPQPGMPQPGMPPQMMKPMPAQPPMGGGGSMPQPGMPTGGFIPQRPMGAAQQRNPMMAQQAQANMLRRY